MKRVVLAAAMVLTACKGDRTRQTADNVATAAAVDASSLDAAIAPDAGSRISDADFDKVMQELVVVAGELLPIVSQSKDCGAVAANAAQLLSDHSDLFVKIQEIPDFEARARAWKGNVIHVTTGIEGDMRCVDDPRIKRLLAIALPNLNIAP